MIYTRKQFARDLLAEMDHGYDVVRLARWAFSKKMDPDLQIKDPELDAMVMQVVAMEEGSEFEYDETELREMAQRALDDGGRMMPNHERTGLRIDLYEGAYGLTLRIATRSLKGLGFLRANFEALASGSRREVTLCKDVGVHMDGCDVFRLLAPTHNEVSLAVVTDEEGRTVRWAQPPESWRRACGLLDGLDEYGTGHQYLTDMEPNPLLIELSYRE